MGGVFSDCINGGNVERENNNLREEIRVKVVEL
jgi:hypothetical protein